MTSLRPPFRAALLVSVWTLGALDVAVADEAVVFVGRPDGLAPRDRVDAHRNGRTSTALPSAPVERWRVDLQSTLELTPLVDRTGAVMAVSASGEVTRIDASGRVEWKRRLSGMVGNAPPVLLPSGAVAIVLADATLHRIASDGTVAPPLPLRGTALQTSCAPLARDDGGLVVAMDGELVAIGPTGDVQARARLDVNERLVGGVLPFDGGVLAVSAQGRIWQWRAPGAARVIGAFGGTVPEGATLLGDRALAAVVARERLVVFDPLTGSARTLLQGTPLARVEGPPTLAPSGEILVTNGAGELLVVSPAGSIVRRVELVPPRPLPASAARAPRPGHDVLRNPALIVDPRGAVAYLRRDGRFGIVDELGTARAGTANLCPHPLAVVPAGEGALLTVCASGSITRWVDR